VKRRLFNLLAVVSLVIFVSAAVACVASLDRTRFHVIGSPPSLYGIGSGGGILSIGQMQFDRSHPPRDPLGDASMMATWRRRSGGHGDIASALGFDYYDEVITSNNIFYGEILSFQVLAVSYGPILSAAGILPAAWICLSGRQYFLLERRRRIGHCVKCGYDLRASKDRCPECGTAISAAGARSAQESESSNI
jgi:predicted RNA-binding Zn-ribbon protein involved in translation (DUF1610 family)